MNIAISGLEIAEFGMEKSDPLLLFHEGLGSLNMWKDFPVALAAATGRQVIAWSREGYGASPPGLNTYDDDFMHQEADAAAATMQKMGITQAHVFGHSDGASIALLLAARQPHRILSLTLEAPHVFVEAICLAAINKLHNNAKESGFLDRLGKYHQDVERMFERWCSIWLKPSFADWSIVSALSDIKCPILLIQGENDEYGSFAQLDRIAAHCPRSLQLRLDHCGHSPHVDRRADVISATTEFLKDIAHG
jgi:pimeloyl-ACP methyl ester carboxylesterase